MLAAAPLLAQRTAPFEVEEATIAQVHAAMQAGQLTCRTLVAQYLKRIAASDKNARASTPLILINPISKNSRGTGPPFFPVRPYRAAALRAGDRQR
jgi:hypothetical protein